jgi:hypothetical protein
VTDRLTDELVSRVMDWRIAPDRYLKPGRSWIPKWRFNPLQRLDDAFQLLDHTGGAYTLAADSKGVFTAEVRIRSEIGRATGDVKARTITLAIARALKLEVPPEHHQQGSVREQSR